MSVEGVRASEVGGSHPGWEGCKDSSSSRGEGAEAHSSPPGTWLVSGGNCGD